METTPYSLLGLEFAWKIFPPQYQHHQQLFVEQANMVYRLQEQRWQQEKVFTSKGDYYRLGEPHHIIDTLYANGQPWNIIDENGKWYPKLGFVSTKIAFIIEACSIPFWSLIFFKN